MRGTPYNKFMEFHTDTANPIRILIVTTDNALCRTVKKILQNRLRDVSVVKDIHQVMDLPGAESDQFSCVLYDLETSICPQENLLSQLRIQAKAPILVILPQKNIDVSLRKFLMNASAVILKDLLREQLETTMDIVLSRFTECMEYHFRSIVDSGVALIWTSAPDKKCDYFNQPWLQFTGRKLESELGYGWAEGVHPDDLERCVAIYEKSFEAREKFNMEYRLHTATGEYKWIQDFGTPRFDKAGNFIGYVGHCIDVDMRKKAEDDLKEKINELERFSRLTVDRELHMIELKKEVNMLLEEYKPPRKYTIHE